MCICPFVCYISTLQAPKTNMFHTSKVLNILRMCNAKVLSYTWESTVCCKTFQNVRSVVVFFLPALLQFQHKSCIFLSPYFLYTLLQMSLFQCCVFSWNFNTNLVLCFFFLILYLPFTLFSLDVCNYPGDILLFLSHATHQNQLESILHSFNTNLVPLFHFIFSGCIYFSETYVAVHCWATCQNWLMGSILSN